MMYKDNKSGIEISNGKGKAQDKNRGESKGKSNEVQCRIATKSVALGGGDCGAGENVGAEAIREDSVVAEF